MWEAIKSVAFVLFSVMVALILQAHAEVDEGDYADEDDSGPAIHESYVEQVQAQMPTE